MRWIVVNRLLIVILVVFAISCSKSKKSAPRNKGEFMDMDIERLMKSDDYFRIRKQPSDSPADSLRISQITLNDLNGDGNHDSAVIRYNINNSKYRILFSCFPDAIVIQNAADLLVKDLEDMNGDGLHEIMLILQSDGSCWDEIRLYSYTGGKWAEKYQGQTYQCTEGVNYKFRKVDGKTVELVTYGSTRDSIDAKVGDTTEILYPEQPNAYLIRW